MNGISEINQLFDDILIIWPAPVCIYIYIYIYIAQLYMQFILIFQFILLLFIYVYMCVFLFSSYFLLSLCCFYLCVLEACDTKTNSLYAQTYLAIKVILTSDPHTHIYIYIYIYCFLTKCLSLYLYMLILKLKNVFLCEINPLKRTPENNFPHTAYERLNPTALISRNHIVSQ